jgi:hypothetical protein
MAFIRRLVTAAVVAGVATAGAVGVVGPAAAEPPERPPTSGCPGGQLLSVAELEAVGPYMAPRQIDSEGNEDDYVCGKALTVVAAERSVCGGPCPVPVIYLFRDNDLAGYEP